MSIVFLENECRCRCLFVPCFYSIEHALFQGAPATDDRLRMRVVGCRWLPWEKGGMRRSDLQGRVGSSTKSPSPSAPVDRRTSLLSWASWQPGCCIHRHYPWLQPYNMHYACAASDGCAAAHVVGPFSPLLQTVLFNKETLLGDDASSNMQTLHFCLGA